MVVGVLRRLPGEVPLPARLPVGSFAEDAVRAAAAAAARLAAHRGVPEPDVVLDPLRVAASFTSDRHLRINGEAPQMWAELSGFWRASDSFIRTHANYPHHRQRLLSALGLSADITPAAFAAAARRCSAMEIEEAVTAAGGVAVAVRTPAQWRAHPQGDATATLAPLAASRIGDAPPRGLGAPPEGPLLPAAGLRVLDLTRVIAGPVATRTLALLGADVLRIDPPAMPEIAWQFLDNGAGKRSAQLDLRDAAGRDRFKGLLAEADVLVTGYRPGALAAFGLEPDRLAEQHPGLVIARLSAWGMTGPWAQRRGFDSIVQAATGIAWVESPDGETPGALPAQALDHGAGHLLAAGVLTAVARQLDEGGTWLVETSLAALARALLDEPRAEAGVAVPTDWEACLVERDTPSGLLRYALPAVLLDGGPQDYPAPGRVWGADPPAWQTRNDHAVMRCDTP